MWTVLPPATGTRSIAPKYWPLATSGALILIGKVSVPFFPTWRFAFFLPTVIVTPAGWVMTTLRVWALPETLIAVRLVEIVPAIVGALTLGMFRSIRWRTSVPAPTKSAKVSLKTSVGFTARSARMEPAPMSNGVAGVTPSSLTTVWTDDVMRADLISSGVHEGWAAFTRAETPAACGLDIEVPAMAMNRLPAGPLSAVV